ncbi:uncharacterized protein L969DRAFT_43732 [Mixia osmundae IAM 14324]|uniref:AB hydrolase-1 domain-containing protein n=1 Tax=Mixia osmundae (strain CBS 9802 / IAM 14324 / JCM 22182 / KY 12970) TaxID=764103 RepID=G7DZY6_MIXOS|nr:uncharacterized protein L969DRAFT_43732 [Mixia osmundae IAM 14324]KEI42137.1 hypothetical protein L969DRAFT_43732 [Mixia osmundae IAM 14324]GAA96146.1 hypothetical protein E5Q_02807 [Mixia osmundae IAM 14324]
MAPLPDKRLRWYDVRSGRSAERFDDLPKGGWHLPYDETDWFAPAESGHHLDEPDLIVVFVPGNPGLVDYYTDFLTTVADLTNPRKSPKGGRNLKTDVIAISHLAQATSPLSSLAYSAILSGKLPTLADQVDHKIACIDRVHGLFPKAKIVLIGHSVGAWICCQVLKARPKLVSRAQLLFPTISDIAATPNAQRLWPIFNRVGSAALVSLTMGTSFLPLGITSRLTGVAQRAAVAPEGDATKATLDLVTSPTVVASALAMARDEMATIKDLDKAFLAQYGDRLDFYWAEGDSDGWVRSSQIQEIIETVQDKATHQRCVLGMKHAFCLKDGAQMGRISAKWILST